jgi:hypothetical protein
MSQEIKKPDDLDVTVPMTREDERSRRYIASLHNLEQAVSLEEIYPSEIKRHQWEVVTDEDAIQAVMSKVPLNRGFIQPLIQSVYRDEEGHYVFLAPNFGNRFSKPPQIFLDILATAKEIAPWSPYVGLAKSPDTEYFEGDEDNAFWSCAGLVVTFQAPGMENIINALGSKEISTEEKSNLLLGHTASLVHEATHMKNEQGAAIGYGPAKVMIEAAPILEEYLAFPKSNPKMSTMVNRLQENLANGKVSELYQQALALGILLLIDGEDLPIADSCQGLAQAIMVWRQSIEGMAASELAGYRQQAEESCLLSSEDANLKLRLISIVNKYPVLMAELGMFDYIKDKEARINE